MVARDLTSHLVCRPVQRSEEQACITCLQPVCAGLFDAEKEIARLAKQQEKLQADVSSAEARLSNEKFTSKAPERVVAEFRNQRDQGQQKLAAIQEKIEQMKRYL